LPQRRFVAFKTASGAKSRGFIATKRLRAENFPVLREQNTLLLRREPIHRDKVLSFSARGPFTAANRLQPQNLPLHCRKTSSQRKFSRFTADDSFLAARPVTRATEIMPQAAPRGY
jgi:hypothetical protein